MLSYRSINNIINNYYPSIDHISFWSPNGVINLPRADFITYKYAKFRIIGEKWICIHNNSNIDDKIYDGIYTNAELIVELEKYKNDGICIQWTDKEPEKEQLIYIDFYN